MPSLSVDNPLSVLSNSANSSFDGNRKSYDKTISGVFTYTNGTDVETGFSEHRLEQLKNLRNNSHNSLTNGIPNGVPKGGRERSHSKSGSTHSIGSGRNLDGLTRSPASYDGLSRLSNVENVSDTQSNGAVISPEHSTTKTSNRPSAEVEHDPSHQVAASTSMDVPRSDGTAISRSSTRLQPPLNRFSSATGMSPGASIQDRRVDAVDLPPLIHRHTLQVPKAPTATSPASRDFSFSAGPSEEAMYASGRFSPTRDANEGTHRHRRASLALVRRATRSMQSDALLDEIPPDEDAARWTEVIKQKRASRRKRKEEEDDDRVVVGKKVEEGHVNWVTAYNMLTGIRFTVSRTNAKMDRELTEADFDARHKFSFDVTGNELTPSAKYDFKFKDYSPWVFRHLRAIFGLDPADYLMSLTSKYILSELGSPGKSGSFFYFSRDYKYIIKTIHHAEHKLLRKILREYYQHVVDNPNTLISQFYGLHRVKIPYGRKIHFVVMNNLFPPHRDIHKMFDLKGSTVGRDFKEEDLAANPRATLKDLNWLRRDLHLEFNARVKQIFIEQVHRDVALLQKLHIMDYSLLVGMHDMEKGNEEKVRETTLKVFQPGGEKDQDDLRAAMLTRTPSRLENMRKARELRLTLKKEKPVLMGLTQAKMPEDMDSADERRDRVFYGDDGGIKATHEDGRDGDMIYYLGIIDCLTHYGFVKRLEHFWKGLKDNRTQISPVPPQAYGDRFVNFITGVTMTQEEAERQYNSTDQLDRASNQPKSRRNSLGLPLSFDTRRSEEPRSPTTSPIAVANTMQKAQKQVDKSTDPDKGRRQSEEEKPDRTLTTDESKRDVTLPAVTEAGESGDVSERQYARDVADESSSDPPPTSYKIPGIRKVSASTRGEAEDLPSLSTTMTSEQENREDEEFDEKRSSQPPRLDSNIIPKLTPLYSSPDALEPEKSILRSIDDQTGDVERLPNAAVNHQKKGI